MTLLLLFSCEQQDSKSIVKKEIKYQLDSLEMNGYLVYDESIKEKRPAILVVHEWWGQNDYPRKRAEMLAELGYVAFAIDMYGVRVVWRRDEKMYEAEGLEWSGESVSYYDAATGAEATENVPSEVIVLENDVKYAVDMACGHKTGFYVDQRENRLAMREMSRGKKVLDVCCYTGGFALNAALGGASSVTAVDSSDVALTVAARNAELNDVQDKVRFVRADAFDFMQSELGRVGGAADVVADVRLSCYPH